MFFQLIVNMLIAAAIYTLVAIGFALIYRILRFIDFSYAFMFTISAYLVLLSKPLFTLYASLVIAVLLTSAIGCALELCLYRPLRKAGASDLIFFLVSLGVYVLLQNIISMVFGDETRSIRTGIVEEGINVVGARIASTQIITIFASIALVIALSIVLKKSGIGKLMRAVANDPILANISGINSNRVILWTFAISSGLAGLAGILVALDVDMTPTMGMNALMMGVVAVIIGGANSIVGITFGALLLAIAQNLGAWYIGSQWQDAIAFMILVLFLLFKPEGFFGKKVKASTV